MNSNDASRRGDDAETDLARGERMALRRWDREAPADWKPDTERRYETAGYVIEGRAELRIGADTRTLRPGDAYIVPAGAAHSYKILEAFTAIEAISPPQDGRT